MRALDRSLPDFHFSERHAASIRAPAAGVYRAIWDVTLAEMPLVGLLFWIRALPVRLLGRRYRPTAQLAGAEVAQDPLNRRNASHSPILRVALSRTFTLLHETPDREVALGTIGRFWQASGGSVTLPDSHAFESFQDPTYARAAMDFRLTPADDGRTTQLTTETRIQIADPAARRRFGTYWFFVYPGSALIRLLWLHAIKRRAERLVPA